MRNIWSPLRPAFKAVILLALICTSARGQWVTQSIPLVEGWNAVYLHVDASHATVQQLIAADSSNPILEVWLWNPSGTAQFSDSPSSPLDTGSQWASWVRNTGSGTLSRLIGNGAYLVRVQTGVTNFVWNVKGKAVSPLSDWTTTGLNFIDFPTVPTNPPTFESFLAQAPDLKAAIEVYYYKGGELSAQNPARLLAFRTTPVKRGQALWIRSGTLFNKYFGPFSVDFQGGRGIDFGTDRSSATFHLANLTTNTLTVTATLIASETPPSGQSAIAGAPPMLIRGSINLANLTYGYTNLPLSAPRTWTLAPKETREIVVGLNRSLITNAPGAQLAGVLRLTDSLGFSQVDAPVTATATSSAGLWVGRAVINQVGQYLKTYQMDSDGKPVAGDDGKYVATSVNTSLTSVPRAFQTRLIVHNPDAGGNAVLLQRAFIGPDANTNFVVATGEGALNAAMLSQARRISSSQFPWTADNTRWAFNGRLGSASNLTTTVTLDYNDSASNPFLHAYHPDHDNLDATFKNVLQPGAESYTVKRQITLNLLAPANDFANLISSSQQVAGDYLETITVLGLPRGGGAQDARVFQVRGGFMLTRISNVPTLTLAQ